MKNKYWNSKYVKYAIIELSGIIQRLFFANSSLRRSMTVSSVKSAIKIGFKQVDDFFQKVRTMRVSSCEEEDTKYFFLRIFNDKKAISWYYIISRNNKNKFMRIKERRI